MQLPASLRSDFIHIASELTIHIAGIRNGLIDWASAYQITLGFGPSLIISVILNASPGDGITVPGVSAATGRSPVGFRSIVTAFGINMTSLTEAATTTPPPTTLGGVRVHIGGTLAPLYYVSPGQINFALPLDATGTISLEQVGKAFVPKGVLLPIVATAPGLFTVNSSGLAAASAIKLTANGPQPVSVASCSATGCVPCQ